ncbi:anthranilate phosphoribosyltransferase [Magnetococcus marinus MC-1]|uniref:Anthranilate phosphoribosyltransferase n=1 Tax=Magnetococcus marinus (strain ATCC BAA-1437 / JCM 17883 / MC-1) TaxID=156889 RepID=A0L6P2_MAGMM|nr:anthranilate phosphoribosyltransferase [Magnetococcus marinus]ABK43635.1 anthranilate phosphoribosyltransferase [Magnetococcus marinus MC-1]
MSIQAALARVVDGHDLSQPEAYEAMLSIMSGRCTDAQIGAFITALRMKGESIAEIAGAAQAMREMAHKVKASGAVVDTCGTGGDALGTFNISTTVAFVVAACGVTVAKHGNRSITSKSGSADVLKALGVNIEADTAVVETCLQRCGMGFLFAVKHHGAMKHAIGPRKELAIRTIFNLLGPLTNPASAPYQLIGVFDGRWTEPMAQVLGRLGSSRAMVVHGNDGLDEITITTTTQVSELKSDGQVTNYTLDPQDFGLPLANISELKGGEASENAAITRAILSGTEQGAKRHVVVLNAAAALYISGMAQSMTTGKEMAEQALDSGRALKRLQMLVETSNVIPEPT